MTGKPTREHQILTEIAMGGFSIARGKDGFEEDAAIVQSLYDRSFITSPFVHHESRGSEAKKDLVRALGLTQAGRAYLETLKRS